MEKKKMKKLLLALLFFSFSITFSSYKGYDISRGRYYPTTTSLGNSGIAGFMQANAVQLNPANIAHYKGWNSYWYSTLFEKDLSHSEYTALFQFFDLGFGVSYVYQLLGNIPNTDLILERIRKNGYFSEYISQVQFHIAKKFTNLFFLKEFDIGASLSVQNYSFSSNSDLFFRIGSLLSLDLFPHFYLGLLLNDTSENELLNIGIHYKQPEYKIFLDKGDKGIVLGGEYELNSNVFLRAGIEKDYLGLGIGYFYNNLYFLGNEDMGIQFDYALQLPLQVYPFETQHFFGISIKEQEKLPIPFLYEYPLFTNQDMAQILGWSLRNTDVHIYKNDVLIDIAKTNRNGYWETMLPLNNDLNDFYFKSWQKRPRKESNYSKNYRIIVDKIAPDMTFEAFVYGHSITIDIYPNEPLSDMPYLKELKEEAKYHDNKYSIEGNILQIYDGFSVKMTDRAKNNANIKIKEPFINFIHPQQKITFTYKNLHQIVGEANFNHNITIKNTNNDYIEKILLSPIKVSIFKPIIPIETGINTIIISDEVTKGKVHYKYNIISLFKYKDIDDFDADILATTYILPRESLFEPLRRVREDEVIHWIASLIQKKSLLDDNKMTLNEAYQIALDKRWLSEKDERRYITRGEAMDIVSKAFIYNIYDTEIHNQYFENIKNNHPYYKAINYFVENGLLATNEKFYDTEVFIRRGEVLEWIKKSHYYLELRNNLK
jgi:hypothetical protein